MNRRYENKKGITLVALVITIIILLILATISIQSLTHTGLFKRAQEAATQTQKAQIAEEVELLYIEAQMDYHTKNTKITSEKEYLEEKFNNYTTASGAILKYDKEKDQYQYIDKKQNVYNLVIDESGNVTILDGNGLYATLNINNNNEITLNTKIDYSIIGTGEKEITLKIGDIILYNTKTTEKNALNTINIDDIKEKIKALDFGEQYSLILEIKIKDSITKKEVKVTNYTLSNEKDVKTLANIVNNGNNLQGKTIYQICDIDLHGSESNKWTPIGNKKNSFYGTYNGGQNNIENLYINYNEGIQPQGYFGQNDGNISDVIIKSGSLKSNKCTGAVVGYNNGQVQRCINHVNVTLNSTLDGDSCGGVIGTAKNGSVSELVNYGEISAITTGKATRTGGVVGCVDNNTILNYCYNVGNITATTENGLCCQTAGVAPLEDQKQEPIYNSYNLGNITVNENGEKDDRWAHVGGISTDIKYMYNCFNAGKITFSSTYGKGTHVGGLYGTGWDNVSIFKNCYWLKGSYSKAGSTQFYADPDKSEIIEVNSEAELKNKALEILGTEHYKKDENNINNRWPIFKWQK